MVFARSLCYSRSMKFTFRLASGAAQRSVGVRSQHRGAARSARVAASVSAFSLGLCASLLLGCSSTPEPGGVRFVVRAAPPPDDVLLSPLRDARVTAIELRDARAEDLLARSRFDPQLPDSMQMTAALSGLDLGQVAVSGKRDLRLLTLGAAGQQVLGVALSREAEWQYGTATDIFFELRRPLFFFGGSQKLVAPVTPPDPVFAPGRRIFEALRDETKLRVVDPNSVTSLLPKYDLQLDSVTVQGQVTSTPVSAAAGTYDGQSLLACNLLGNLHVIDTLSMIDQSSVKLPDAAKLPPQAVVVDPKDQTAVVLMYAKVAPPSGPIGHLAFVRDLPGLRSRVSKDGNLLTVDVEAATGQPLAAAYAPDGLIDVVFGRPPLQVAEPDCSMNNLSGPEASKLRRYDPQTGAVREERSLPYTTSVVYNSSGERVLVQPCGIAAGAIRRGQVVIARASGDKVLAAPGVMDIATTKNGLVAVGRDDLADSPTTLMHATVNTLEGSADKWSTSQFDLPAWEVPFRITTASDGQPYTSSLNISFSPTDVLVYSVAVTPDRARALALMRVSHKTRGMYLSTLGVSPDQTTCYIDWSGYTYHVLLINLQTGAREQDYIVGVQNQDCGSRNYDKNNKLLGQCFGPCDPTDSKPYLRLYQEGYVPTAASVLFGR